MRYRSRFSFATSVNAELATEANSINFRKTSGAELNLADAKGAKFQDAHFKNADTAASGTNPNSSQKATLIDEAKNFYRVDERLFRSAQLDGKRYREAARAWYQKHRKSAPF